MAGSHHQEGDPMAVAMESAYDAARRGDLDELDRRLGRLRLIDAAAADGVSEKLRTIADCVRAHPAFDPSQTAGGRGRAAG